MPGPLNPAHFHGTVGSGSMPKVRLDQSGGEALGLLAPECRCRPDSAPQPRRYWPLGEISRSSLITTRWSGLRAISLIR